MKTTAPIALPLLTALILLGVGPTATADTAADTATDTASPAASQPASQPAGQNKVKQVEAFYAQGAAMFKAGAYKEALKRFSAAYALIPVSNLLYNMGRCYEALGKIDEALSHYKRCMAHKESSKEAKLRSAQRYEVLVKARVSGAQATKPTQPAVQEERSSGGGLLTVMRWTTLGLGVAFAVAGAVTYTAGVADHDEIESLPGYGNPNTPLEMTRSRALELSDDGTNKKTIGVVFFGAAGAALATSALLFLLPRGEKAGGPDVALSVAPDPHSGAHVLLRGVF